MPCFGSANPKPQTPNPELQTPNPKPGTLNPKPSLIKRPGHPIEEANVALASLGRCASGPCLAGSGFRVQGLGLKSPPLLTTPPLGTLYMNSDMGLLRECGGRGGFGARRVGVGFDGFLGEGSKTPWPARASRGAMGYVWLSVGYLLHSPGRRSTEASLCVICHGLQRPARVLRLLRASCMPVRQSCRQSCRQHRID